MANLYLLVDLAILAAPLALSFDRKVAFFRHWRSLAFSLVIVSSAYIGWDVLATAAGHWWFNPDYSGTVRIGGLPLGEILFFYVVPYACLFIYEVVRGYVPERTTTRVAQMKGAAVGIAAIFLALAAIYRTQGYTPLAMGSVAVMLLVVVVFDPSILMSTHSLLFFGIALIPFMIANGVLTALPIVGYGEESIWGVRVTTIPLEDFFYNLGMLGFYLFFYRLGGRLIVGARRRATGAERLADSEGVPL